MTWVDSGACRPHGADEPRLLELSLTFDEVPVSSWERSGLRGDGRVFTVQSFASFVLHEVEHHLQDAKQGLRKDS